MRRSEPATTLFLTGTDTGVGKTHVAVGLVRAARALGIAACGYKPVASGCRKGPHGLRNADARALLSASALQAGDYERVNPYAFAPAIAPHLAAQEVGIRIRRPVLDRAHRALCRDHDLVIVEGAGGWQVPLGPDWTFADWVEGRRWPVVLVVGMRLGCLNHALLSAESIARRTRLLGWVANAPAPQMPRLHRNVADLERRMPAPLLASIGADEVPGPAALCSILAQAQSREGR